MARFEHDLGLNNCSDMSYGRPDEVARCRPWPVTLARGSRCDGRWAPHRSGPRPRAVMTEARGNGWEWAWADALAVHISCTSMLQAAMQTAIGRPTLANLASSPTQLSMRACGLDKEQRAGIRAVD